MAMKKRLASILTGLLAVNFLSIPSYAKAIETPELILTELMPNTSNIGTSDAYEFIELYNNSQRSINTKDYKIIYDYQSATPSLTWDIYKDVEIPANKSFILWVDNGKNSDLTVEDLKNEFNLSGVEDKYVIKMDCGGGMANTSSRTLRVQRDDGTEISSASYTKEDVPDDKTSIHYKYNTSSTEAAEKVVGIPTPLSLSENEGLSIQNDTEKPTIMHTKINDIEDISKNLQIYATIADDKKIESAKVYYKSNVSSSFESIDMQITENDNYRAIISAENILGSFITYYIEASDGINVTKTEEYTVNIKSNNPDNQNQSPLLITELLPDSKTNINGSDGYEFIEIYNNTDKDIDFKDYKIRYHYPDKGDDGDVLWPSTPENVLIHSGKTLVFWIINGNNDALTIDDFNKYFNTSLVDGKDIVRIYSAGMANGSPRGIKISTNTNVDLVKAVYNINGEDNVDPDKGIQYRYNEEDPFNLKLLELGNATPGQVSSMQIPTDKLILGEDKESPKIEIKSNSAVDSTQNFDINAVIKDNKSIKTVTLYIKSSAENSYNSYNLLLNKGDKYSKVLSTTDLIGKKYFDYYFVASDGVNSKVSDVQHVKVDGAIEEGLRLNIQDGFIGNKKVSVKTTVDDYPSNAKLYIDNEDVTLGTKKNLEKEPVFSVDVTQTDVFFKNGIAIGDDILKIFDEGLYSKVETIAVPISTSYLSQDKKLTVSIHSGTKKSPFQHYDDENSDDYQVKNIRLILPDGRELKSEEYGNSNNFINIGDSTGMKEILDCTFTIPDDAFKSLEYEWDTTKFKDGEYVISTEDRGVTKAANVKVDNTAPEISTNMITKQYKGDFVIEASATDELSGFKSLKAYLDEEEVNIPYKTSSTILEAGEHNLIIKAEDNVGNISEKNIKFTTPVENPDIPNVTSSNDGKLSGTKATLKATVKDSTGDNMDVSFKKGYKFTVNDKEVTVKSGESEYHPTDGKVVSNELLERIKTRDGEVLTIESLEKFPYQIFEVDIPKGTDEKSLANIQWQGSSNAGSKISMYVYNYTKGIWEDVISKEAKDNDIFELKAQVEIKDRMSDNKLKVMVQEYIISNGKGKETKNVDVSGVPTGNTNDTPRENYDFSFAWLSDTQYYNEEYYEHQTNMNKWIIANKDRINLKYVFHTGDIVDESDKVEQWNRADEAYKWFDDAGVPYGVLAGNHDVGHKSEDYTEYYKYFGEDRYKDNPWYGESYKNNRGHYDLISAGGIDFIMIYMGWGVNDEDINWMNSVLKQYPNRKAILNFHEYLLATGGFGDIPQRIHDEVVKPNSNVSMVFSGHYHNANQKVEEFDDDGDGVSDRKVYQILFDYQALAEGGLGYLRILHFDTKNGKIIFRTYSPSLDDYDAGDFPIEQEEFDVAFNDINIEPKQKKISTDYMEVNIYTNEVLGEVKNVASGSEVSINLENLTPHEKIGWYVEARDKFGGISRSEVNYLIAGTNELPSEGVNNPEQGGSNPGNGGSDNGGSISPNPDKGGDNKDNQSDPKNDNNLGKVDNSKEILPQTGFLLSNDILILLGILLICGGIVITAYRKRLEN